MNILFFGSTSDSVLVLQKLSNIAAVVTQPPKPIGRKQMLIPTPVECWAKEKNISVFTSPPQEKFDLVVSASYGEKIPFPGVNVHPSLLPRWRGGDPVPWAILSGDREVGVSLVTLTEKFDRGLLLAQEKIPVLDTDMTDPLRAKLFSIGADLLVKNLPDILSKKIQGTMQNIEGQPYARRLTREDGFEPWEKIMDPDESARINRKYRAFHPWPGLWTLFGKKRLKILEFTTIPVVVQLEGKTPVSWEQFQKAYLTP